MRTVHVVPDADGKAWITCGNESIELVIGERPSSTSSLPVVTAEYEPDDWERARAAFAPGVFAESEVFLNVTADLGATSGLDVTQILAKYQSVVANPTMPNPTGLICSTRTIDIHSIASLAEALPDTTSMVFRFDNTIYDE